VWSISETEFIMQPIGLPVLCLFLAIVAAIFWWIKLLPSTKLAIQLIIERFQR
jgi:hypothetical protein